MVYVGCDETSTCGVMVRDARCYPYDQLYPWTVPVLYCLMFFKMMCCTSTFAFKVLLVNHKQLHYHTFVFNQINTYIIIGANIKLAPWPQTHVWILYHNAIPNRFMCLPCTGRIMNTDDYLKAGRIAGEVREMARNTDWVGKTAYDLCEHLESEIKKRGARCAFPVNVSINDVAAHYTAEPNDTLTIADDDLVKIDLGAHINGYIADTAVTVCYDSMYADLVDTAERALAKAISIIRSGIKARDIGRAIESVIKDSGFKPIANLSGHSLDQYVIHAGKTIPNIWSLGGFSLSGESAYACEPFVTTKEGGGFVRNGKIKNIFALVTRKRTKDAEADRLLDHIWNEFNTLPFALRWLLPEWEEARARELLDLLVKKKAVQAYPVLMEIHGQRVAQAEHTFIPNDNGSTIVTAAPQV